MILFENTPYRSDKDLVEAYNSFMRIVPDDAWVLFRDADTLFLDSFYGKQIEETILRYDNIECFTAVTNRIYRPEQLHKDKYDGDDIKFHRNIATQLKNKYGTRCEKYPDVGLMSGFCFLLKKTAWKKIGGFKPWHKNQSKMLGVDNQLHKDLKEHGIDVMIMKGLYVYHWYRGGDAKKTDHLK
jgi:GT2 family glycosyltransferase